MSIITSKLILHIWFLRWTFYLISRTNCSENVGVTATVLDFLSRVQSSNTVEIILANIPADSTEIDYTGSMVAVSEIELQPLPLDEKRNNLLVCVTFHSNLSFFYKSFENGQKDQARNPPLTANFHVWPDVLETVGDEVLNNIIQLKQLQQLDSDVYIIFVVPTSCNTKKLTVEIWEIYQIKDTRIIQKVNLNLNWHLLTWNYLTRKIPRRTDFRQANITAIAGDDPDYDWEAKFVDDKTLSILESGSAVHMFWFLADALNFSVQALRGTWMGELDNGALGGMAIELMRGEADICISLSSLTTETAKKFSYLQPTDVDTIKAFFVQPSSSAIRDIFLSMFTIHLWWVCGLVVIGMPIMLKIVIWRHTRRQGWFRFTETRMADESFLWSVATFCQQGWYKTPHFTSTNIIFTVGYFTGLLCYQAFSAGIVSKLSVEIKPINSFDDLVSFDYVLYADKDTIPYHYILPDVPSKQMKSMEEDDKVGMDLSKAFQRIIKTRSALLSYDDVLLMSSRTTTKAERILCEKISSLRATKKDVPFSMIVPKESPFREFFNQKICLMKERGFNKRFDMMYNQGVKLACTKKTDAKKQLSTSDLFSAFVIICSGTSFSVIALVVERLFKRFSKIGRRIEN